jgi:hypothetical protein
VEDVDWQEKEELQNVTSDEEDERESRVRDHLCRGSQQSLERPQTQTWDDEDVEVTAHIDRVDVCGVQITQRNNLSDVNLGSNAHCAAAYCEHREEDQASHDYERQQP